MDISTLVKKDTLNGSRQVLGVYSSPSRAWDIFHSRLRERRFPYTDGIAHYNSRDMFWHALRNVNFNQTSIRIYLHENFEIYIVWKVLDQPLS